MTTPDFPKEQVALGVTAIVGICADLGVNLPVKLQDHVLLLITVAYPLVALALAHIRASRAKVAAAQIQANTVLTAAALTGVGGSAGGAGGPAGPVTRPKRKPKPKRSS